MLVTLMFPNGQRLQLELSYEQTRGLLLEVLGSSNSGGGSIAILKASFKQLVLARGLAHEPQNSSSFYSVSGYSGELPQKYDSWMDDIVWDLIIEGILRPGLGDSLNNGLGWYHISDYGKHVLGDPLPQPYDSHGYLARINEISDLDNVIIAYLEESLKTFRMNCCLSAMTTLGCAADKAVSLLIDACENNFSDSTEKTEFSKKIDTISINRKHDVLSEVVRDKIQAQAPDEIKANLNNYLDGVFNIVRAYKDDAGHPSSKNITKEELHSYFVIFPSYLEKICSFIEWLSQNPV